MEFGRLAGGEIYITVEDEDLDGGARVLRERPQPAKKAAAAEAKKGKLGEARPSIRETRLAGKRARGRASSLSSEESEGLSEEETIDSEAVPATPVESEELSLAERSTPREERPTAAASSSQVVLRDYQSAVVRRMVARCSKQHGILLVHSMGSGKTASALAIAENMGISNSVLILTPKGLDTSFRKDAAEYHIDLSRYQFLDYDDLKALLSTDDSEIEGRVRDVTETIRNSVVICDESHNLIKILRDTACSNPYVRNQFIGAFRMARKVVLLSGTPMTTGWGDFAALVNLAAGVYVAPGDDDRFAAEFSTVGAVNYIGSLLSLAQSAAQLLSVTGRALSYVSMAASYAGSSTYELVRKSTSGIAGFLTSVLSSVTKGYVAGEAGVTNELINFNLATMKAESSVGILSSICLFALGSSDLSKGSLDLPRVFQALKPYVSYFDTSQIEDEVERLSAEGVSELLAEQKKKLLDFPYVAYHEDSVSPDEFQVQQIVKNSVRTGLISTESLSFVGRIDPDDYTGTSFESVDDRKTWNEKMRVIGNLSSDCGVLDIVPTYQDFTMNAISVRSRRYTSIVKPGKKRDNNLKFFTCVKYLHAFNLISMYRQKNNYIPIVYTNFDRFGLQTFGAFLSDMGYAYLVLHPDDDQETRSNIEALANTLIPTGNFELMPNLSPICVIVHPKITEGINFYYAPAIICMEPVVGYGTQEQVYARVVRSLNADKREAIENDGNFDFVEGSEATDKQRNRDPTPKIRRRVIKHVHQLCVGFTNTIYNISGVLQNYIGLRIRSLIDFMLVIKALRAGAYKIVGNLIYVTILVGRGIRKVVRIGKEILKSLGSSAIRAVKATLETSLILLLKAYVSMPLENKKMTIRRADGTETVVENLHDLQLFFTGDLVSYPAEGEDREDRDEAEAVEESRRVIDEVFEEAAETSINAGVLGKVSDSLLRIRAFLKEYAENVGRTVADDPFAFYRSRIRNFDVFGPYPDGIVLADNDNQKLQFSILKKSLANLKDDSVTCDVDDLVTIKEGGTPVDLCKAVTTFKEFYKSDPTPNMCYEFNERLATRGIEYMLRERRAAYAEATGAGRAISAADDDDDESRSIFDYLPFLSWARYPRSTDRPPFREGR